MYSSGEFFIELECFCSEHGPSQISWAGGSSRTLRHRRSPIPRGPT